MCVDFKLILNIAQILGVIAAICGLIYQIRRSRFSLNLELVLKFDDKFNGEHFKRKRIKAATSILKKKQYLDAEDIFDFFETVGYLVRKKTLNKKIVWHTFYGWVQGYWSSGIEHIKRKRREENDNTLWEDFEYLHAVLLNIQRSEANKSDAEVLNKNKIIEFLKEEIIPD